MRPTRTQALSLVFAVLIAALALYWDFGPIKLVQAQTVRLVTYATLTLTGSPQQVSASGTCAIVQFYAPGAGLVVSANVDQVIVGDSNISASGTGRGIPLAPGAARSIPAFSTTSLSVVPLSTLYALGTSGDHLMFDCYN